MYMCRYMFIWAVCPTTVEMDLMFVLVVRFLSLSLNRSYYLVRVWPLRSLSVQREPASEPRSCMNVWGEGDRGTGPLEIERDVDFASLFRMEMKYLTRTRASLATALRHTSTATRPSAHLPVCLHL